MHVPLGLKIRTSAQNVFAVLTKPAYGLLTVAMMLLLVSVIVWSLNYQLVTYVLLELPISVAQKIQFFAYGYQSLFTSFDILLSVSVIIISVLFGINIAVLVYAVRRRSASVGSAGTGGVAALLGILSSGCAACGTSLLGPLLATFGATSISMVHSVGAAFNFAGSALLLYSIYKLGLQSPTKN
ncbi:hypothetical protein KDA14_00755 [Candidatus Saccharibacteria bacterium]|nr:hypothetical protein [Candidatus Saccharibacteria bacterium]